MLGLCTGLIPAAAAAIANNTGDLHQYGLEMVAISVRLGHGLWARSKKIEAFPGTWASSCVGATAEDIQPILDRFHEELVILRQPMISKMKLMSVRIYLNIDTPSWVLHREHGPQYLARHLYSENYGRSPQS